MTQARLLMYGLIDEDNYYVDFDFNPNEVQAYFMSDEIHISIVLSGQIYELEYTAKLLSIIKNRLNLGMN